MGHSLRWDKIGILTAVHLDGTPPPPEIRKEQFAHQSVVYSFIVTALISTKQKLWYELCSIDVDSGARVKS